MLPNYSLDDFTNLPRLFCFFLFFFQLVILFKKYKEALLQIYIGICLDFDVLREGAQELVGRRAFLDSFVLPDYQQFNIANIGSVLGKIFSVKSLVKANLPDNCVDDFSGVEKVVLFVVDGLGYNRLVSHMEKLKGAIHDLADKGTLKALTSSFPSTTSTALTSIFTGLPPINTRRHRLQHVRSRLRNHFQHIRDGTCCRLQQRNRFD